MPASSVGMYNTRGGRVLNAALYEETSATAALLCLVYIRSHGYWGLSSASDCSTSANDSGGGHIIVLFWLTRVIMP
jgi:hypothetical protein